MQLPDDCVLVANESFSINYADVTIRWGLYESALRYVGWPIVPGFDIAGTVFAAGKHSGFTPGEPVFGCTMFGGYSSFVLVPSRQLRHKPAVLTFEQAAALPAVAGTALHALHLAGFWAPPTAKKAPIMGGGEAAGQGERSAAFLGKNKGVLVHSAAGGVGSMLVQMAKVNGCGPVVGVVGASHKVRTIRLPPWGCRVLKSGTWRKLKGCIRGKDSGVACGSGPRLCTPVLAPPGR